MDTDETMVEEPNQGERTFTQEQVNDLINKRFAKLWDKYGDLDALKEKAARLDEIEEANKTELQKATERADALQKEIDTMKSENTIRSIREKVAEETGVPVKLLTATTEDDCTEQAQEILKFRANERQRSYPNVPDGGEARGSSNRQPRDSFADWFNHL